MDIHVTAEDIVQGQTSNSRKCPVALALKRAFPDAQDIRVYGHYVYVDDKRYWPPASVFEFVQAFDMLNPVKPFSFMMPEPDPAY